MKLLLTGDSIIARYEGLNEPRLNANIEKIIANPQITNTAISGINSNYLLNHLDELILNRPLADYVVILIGTNDCAFHKQIPIARFAYNMDLLAKKVLTKYSAKQLIFISAPAVDEARQRVRDNKTVAKYNGEIEKIAEQYQLHFIDLQKLMINSELSLTEICHGLRNDGLHFGQAGYALMADAIAEIIK
ncbi:GDSL-type esterase/lipase family protein [Lactobacillus psittaci]|uniref:Esterase n=1 Tax=Lactobacillus psittaci DSM 15354 TaxID=1122152 RepID=A0A0R1S4S1_9LACO|nr:GDSL-type esterase/lipase family protein [Lactobacillus psittaci]KRL63916.1 esterase [Lactobacillus psittaci DSM 15354]